MSLTTLSLTETIEAIEDSLRNTKDETMIAELNLKKEQLVTQLSTSRNSLSESKKLLQG
jgi:hypothetical protein